MEVIENMKKETVEAFVTTRIEEHSTLIADGHRTIPTLQDRYQIEAKPFDEDPEHLRWIHTIISNLKSFFQGTFHGLVARHLQRYLDEFCFRFNRRKFAGQLFNRLLEACLSTTTITYCELIG